MEDLPERLRPDESEQPELRVTIGDESYILFWENTWLQFYITGIPEYDEALQKYCHILHKYSENAEGKSDYVIIEFDQISDEELQYLFDNHYPVHIDTELDEYMVVRAALIEAQSIPDAIGQDFGAAT